MPGAPAETVISQMARVKRLKGTLTTVWLLLFRGLCSSSSFAEDAAAACTSPAPLLVQCTTTALNGSGGGIRSLPQIRFSQK